MEGGPTRVEGGRIEGEGASKCVRGRHARSLLELVVLRGVDLVGGSGEEARLGVRHRKDEGGIGMRRGADRLEAGEK